MQVVLKENATTVVNGVTKDTSVQRKVVGTKTTTIRVVTDSLVSVTTVKRWDIALMSAERRKPTRETKVLRGQELP